MADIIQGELFPITPPESSATPESLVAYWTEIKLPVITLWQPYASLLALGLKKWETRPKARNAGGPFLIHAAQTKKGLGVCADLPEKWIRVIADAYAIPEDLQSIPRGGIVGYAEIHRFVSSQKARPDKHERLVGDYQVGRSVWKCRNHHTVPFVPYRGSQGYYATFNPANII